MSQVVRVEVRDFDGSVREHRYANHARKYLQIPVFGAEVIQLFWLRAKDAMPIPPDLINEWSEKVFADPILQEVCSSFKGGFRSSSIGRVQPSFVAEIRFRPGVTDNVGRTSTEAVQLFSEFARFHQVEVYTGKAVYFYGELSSSDVESISQEIIANVLIEEVRVVSWSEYNTEERFKNQKVPEVSLKGEAKVQTISLAIDDRALEKMSKENCWALSLAEMHTIQNYFKNETVIKERILKGLPAEPTDVEMEVIAQTWSEHCKHKIFNAEIDYEENANYGENFPALGTFTVKSVFKSYIRASTLEIEKDRGLDWLISVFTDNAGIVRFDPNLDLCIKVETHNSPSALDPYGGSLTGIVGVNRDILGCGMGARPIANTDVFCLAPPDWPALGDEKELPEGLKHPRRIFDGVHSGVEDGGNKSGIPTVNGAFNFHRDFAGKPLVFCGTIGALPPKLSDGRETAKKYHKPGHKIVMAGGRIGKDGIHGATFSSMELTESAPATAVQIGDPITQRRLTDFLLEARDLGLYSGITDNGAGGLSSSVGEMAQFTNGARLDVTNVPVKYSGLLPFELVVSESQERMTFGVEEEKLERFLNLAKKRSVEASVVGEFNDGGHFQIDYQGKVICFLNLEFLHNGLPPMVLKANWDGPHEDPNRAKKDQREEIAQLDFTSRAFHEKALLSLISRWNIRSKEAWVRRYDHEVQSATLIKPFVGVDAHGPGDAGVIWLEPHGGSAKSGVAISCGLQPALSHFDTYLMAQVGLDEAVRNAVCVGADPDRMAVLDNFCWPDPLPSEKNPDAPQKLAQLVRANKGLYDLAKIYGTPFVSGKDSMKNDFTGRSRFGKESRISVPPTVLVTAMGFVPDVSKTVTSDFRNPGDHIFLLGRSFSDLAGSELEDIFDLPCKAVAPAGIRGEEQLRLYRTIHQAIQKGLVNSCHDCSEGGMLVALTESCIGGMVGVQAAVENFTGYLNEPKSTLTEFFFNETPGRFIVSVAAEKADEFKKLFSAQACLPIGSVSDNEMIRFSRNGLVVLDVNVHIALKAWKVDK